MGLIKTGVKAVVAVKTADVIHERVLKRQQEHWEAHGHPAAAAPAPPPAGAPAAAAPAADPASMLAQLTQLGELRASGVLNEAEFELAKARILKG